MSVGSHCVPVEQEKPSVTALKALLQKGREAVEEFEANKNGAAKALGQEARVKYALAVLHMDAVFSELIDGCEAFLKEMENGR